MGIGLFLDVDRTITNCYIQEKYATLLGVYDKYKRIEDAFQSSKITSPKAGELLIALFNSAGFNSDFAKKCYNEIPLASWADKLLKLNISKYLISSGPSYYIRELAMQYEIPQKNVLCSDYFFSENGNLERCEAVSSIHKRNFVAQKAKAHIISIGVGDSPTHDLPFVSMCDIPIMTVNTPGVLYVESLEIVINIVNEMSNKFSYKKRDIPSLFIASSAENLFLSRGLNNQLERDCDCTIWSDGFDDPTKFILEALEGGLDKYDFAAFIMAPDDFVDSRGSRKATVRDNVIFEYGMFLGRLGRNRCFTLVPRESDITLPTDLIGINPLNYDKRRAMVEPDKALSSCADKIRKRIKKLSLLTMISYKFN